ncbi:MAG: energy-coupling factor transporter ATPase [Mycoplasmoidaceae bacterium]|nr:energy-coupling factor transporter ATPase [Mycoplasmoidaceae bacterium]
MFKTTKKTLIKFDKINFGYEKNKPILSDVSFSILENEYVCIIGANGCGKSTVAKIIAGLLKPWNGSLIFNDEIVTKKNVKNLKQKTGIIFENPSNQFIGLSVEDDIAFGLENQCVDRLKMQDIIDTTSKYVGTHELLKASVHSLSGGQQQLVAITSILAMNPDLIVFDEATSMLDGKSKSKINELILSLKNDKHKTIVSITHDMDEAAKADKIIVMSKGKVAMIGSPNQIFNDPKLESLSLDKPFAYKLDQRINYEK